MRRYLLFLGSILILAVGLCVPPVSAIDINPSKDTAPRSTWDQGGNRFSIFNGDPKRIQRANAVDFDSFDTKVEITPNPPSLSGLKAASARPAVKITFSVHNHGKKTYTLSFPTAQRWDFRIVAQNGDVAYTYSDDHEFVETIGTSMVNNDDKLVYNEQVELADFSVPLHPGNYRVEALMANYPELHASEAFIVQP